MRPGTPPILNLRPQSKVSPRAQHGVLELIQKFNHRHLQQRGGDDELTAHAAACQAKRSATPCSSRPES